MKGCDELLIPIDTVGLHRVRVLHKWPHIAGWGTDGVPHGLTQGCTPGVYPGSVSIEAYADSLMTVAEFCYILAILRPAFCSLNRIMNSRFLKEPEGKINLRPENDTPFACSLKTSQNIQYLENLCCHHVIVHNIP